MRRLRHRITGGLAAGLLVWASLALGRAATAAPSAAPAGNRVEGDEEARAQARALYSRGRAAQQRQDWQSAYAAFAQAWRLAQHYQIAGNLGSVELELGRHRDAAEHLEFALRQLRAEGGAPAHEERALEALLAQASAKVGRVEIVARWFGKPLTDVPIWLDGSLRPQTPVLFVEPGSHRVQVRGGALDSQPYAFQVAPGERRTLTIALHATDGVPATGRAPTPEAAPSTDRQAAAAAGRPIAPAVLGGSLTLAAAAVGIGTAVAAANAQGEAAARADEVAATSGSRAEITCSAAGAPTASGCAAWRDASTTSTTLWGMAAGSFVAAGGAAVATALYLLWPEPTRAARRELALEVGPGTVALTGRFR